MIILARRATWTQFPVPLLTAVRHGLSVEYSVLDTATSFLRMVILSNTLQSLFESFLHFFNAVDRICWTKGACSQMFQSLPVAHNLRLALKIKGASQIFDIGYRRLDRTIKL